MLIKLKNDLILNTDLIILAKREHNLNGEDETPAGATWRIALLEGGIVWLNDEQMASIMVISSYQLAALMKITATKEPK